MAGRSGSPSPSTYTHTAHSSQEWRGKAERAHNHVRPKTQASNGGMQAKIEAQPHTPYPRTSTKGPSQEWRAYRKTLTQTQAPQNSRIPSVHSPGTEAARAMQVKRPNEIRRPGVRLHPKACAALKLEGERATPKHLGTPVPRRCMHASGTGYARKSGEPLGFRPKEEMCASTGAQAPGETSTSRWR